ncbi:MAG: class I SAM-dependent methyltransferase [Acidobacteriota bacterium]|nr:MAG: class I SAM-dependent methyltransferase [Acidobacteriota bacterium]
MNSSLYTIPPGIDDAVDEICLVADTVEGYLHPNEKRFLAIVGAIPTTEGEILEVGAFKGKSTVILARAARLSDGAMVHSVDPMTAPSITDPDLKGALSTLADFRENVRKTGVEDAITLHQMFSQELAPTWDRKLRLLWIDGDHLYAGVRADIEGFMPHLADGAIVAFHDVLHRYDGGIRVFAENILLSPHFGAFGFSGSIGWAQFHADGDTAEFTKQKIKFYRRLARMIPYHVYPAKLSRFEKEKYNFYKFLVPHGRVDPNKWVKQLKTKR